MTAHPTATGKDPTPAVSPLGRVARPRWELPGQIAVGILACLYILQVVSPLRIDSDSAVALSVAVRLAEDGMVRGGTIPLGYPAIVALLIKAGVGTAAALVILNFLFLAIGCSAVWWIARASPPAVRWWTIALTMLSHVILRNSVSPYPDLIGFGLTLTAVGMLSGATCTGSKRNAALIVGATLVTVLLATFRIAGLVLLVPLAWSVFRIVSPDGARSRRRVALAVAILAIILAGLAAAVAVTQDGTFLRYASEIRDNLKRPPLAHAIHRMSVMVRAVGELSINLPISWLAQLRPYLWLLGVLPSLALIRTARNPVWTQPVSVFLLTSLLVLLVWPFYATRLWLPIIPLLILQLLNGASRARLTGHRRWLVAAFAGVYVAGGLAAIAYTTRVSASGENFRFRWGVNGGMASPGYEAGGHNARARALVRRFDAGNPAWRWLDTIPERVFTENLPLRSR